MLTIPAHVQERYYPPDESVAAKLYGWIRREVPSTSTVLDLGAGGGVQASRNLKPHMAKVCAVDIDPIVLDNPCAHEAKLLNDDMTIDYADETFDAVYCDFVFEHLTDPEETLREVARVMKPGGKFFFRTINRWHYLCLLSRCMPRRLSAWLADTLGHAPVGAAKTHETYYRLNSRGQIAKHAAAAGLGVGSLIARETHPIYFHRFAPAWYAGVLMERVMNACPLFKPCRVCLYGYLEKPAAGPAAGHETIA